MINNIAVLFATLERYARRELTLEALQDQISLGLQGYFDQASEEDIELLSEIHSALYEAEDGQLDEEDFHRAVKELLKSQSAPTVITVGHPPSHTYHPSVVKTSTSSANLSVAMKAA